MLTSDPDPAGAGGDQRPEGNVAEFARLVADAFKTSVSELRKDDETKMVQFTATIQGEFKAFRECEDDRIARLEKAITHLKPTPASVDRTTNFWTVYKKVADEHDNDMLSKYSGDLDNSLLFAGLFSAVATTFIVQIIPALQPNPADLTNVLLLRILQQNTSFNGADPLAPVMNVPTSVTTAQSILFASLAVTLFVAFIAVLGKQWILYYKRGSTWGSIVDRGKKRQVKFVGLQKWGLHFIMESLPVLLQFALLLFGTGLAVYLWRIDIYAAEVILSVTCIGFAFYAAIAVAATIRSDCPFKTPLSILLPRLPPVMKWATVLARVWLRRRARQISATLLLWVERAEERGPIGRFFKSFVGGAITPNHIVEDVYSKSYPMTLSNPAFWRNDPLFPSPLPKNTEASAGFWLLENSTDFSAATAVASVFSEFQWPSQYHSATALIRLSDTYMECFRTQKFDKSARLKALQSAAAYYVLYHAWLIWNTSKSVERDVEQLPPELVPDLFLKHNKEWNGADLFEYLLHTEDRSEPVTSAQFLSYIAPYWFCGDSDNAIRFRARRWQTLDELIEVLEKSQALTLVTLTDCVLCVAAAMDFPLHPEDLIRTDKSDFFVLTLKMVVQHIHRIAMHRSRRYHHTAKALEVLLKLVKHTNLPLFDPTWINELLKSGADAEREMEDEDFILFLRLNARRKGEDTGANAGTPVGQDPVHTTVTETDPQILARTVTSETSTPDNPLFKKVMRNIQACVAQESGWQDEAVYGGFIAIKDIRQLESSLIDDSVIQTFHDAMDACRPLRLRKAACDAVLVTRDQWLHSTGLRQKLRELEFFKRLHSFVVDIARSEYLWWFLEVMEVLSEDVYWHSYLREAMDIWLPLQHEGPGQALRILVNVGGLLHSEGGDSSPLEESLEKRLEDEWAAVPGRPLNALTADRLRPLAEVTEQFKELMFDESHRKAVLAVVEKVIPALKKRSEDGYQGPGEDVCGIVQGLVDTLTLPTRRRPSLPWLYML